jgi:hypothetical protein
MSTSPNEHRRIDATFLALVSMAFSTSFIAEADEMFDDGDSTIARDDLDVVPAYVRRVSRDR